MNKNRPKTFREKQIHTMKQINIIMAIITVAMIIFSIYKLVDDLNSVETIIQYINNSSININSTFIKILNKCANAGAIIFTLIEIITILVVNMISPLLISIGTLFQLGKQTKLKTIMTVIFDIIALIIIGVILISKLKINIIFDYKQIIYRIFLIKGIVESIIYFIEFIIITKLLIPKFRRSGGKKKHEKQEDETDEIIDSISNSDEHTNV